MPEFMMLIVENEEERAKLPQSEIAAHYEEIGRWWAEKITNSETVKEVVGRKLQGSATAKTVRVERGDSVVTDGPFAESKEVLGGFSILDVPDMETAVELAKSWPGLAITLELRPVFNG